MADNDTAGQPAERHDDDVKPSAPAKNGGDGLPNAEQLAAALSDERRQRKAAERELAALKERSMSDTERAIAKAKAEGKAEAVREAGKRLAVAEFKAAASGKLGDPAAYLDVIDVSRFVDDDGEPDTKGIAAVVDRLAAAQPANGNQPAPRIPAGPRESTTAESGDFIRAQLNSARV